MRLPSTAAGEAVESAGGFAGGGEEFEAGLRSGVNARSAGWAARDVGWG